MCNSTIGFVIQFVNILLEHACCVNFANKLFVSRFTPVVVVVFFCTDFVIDKLVFRAVFAFFTNPIMLFFLGGYLHKNNG